MNERNLCFVTLVGSVRRGSFTRAIADTLDELAPDDVSVTMLGSVGELPHYNADLERLAFPCGVTEMGAAIAKADAMVIVTPEYNYSMPGALKNALDWLSRLPNQPLKNKALAIQSASPGRLGGALAQNHLRQVLVSLEALVLNKPDIIVTEVAGKVDLDTALLRHPDTRHRIAAQLAALATMVRAASSHHLAPDHPVQLGGQEVRERASQA